jgi:hypothetical protein
MPAPELNTTSVCRAAPIRMAASAMPRAVKEIGRMCSISSSARSNGSRAGPSTLRPANEGGRVSNVETTGTLEPAR